MLQNLVARLQELEEALGYCFRNRDLLVEALTHRSRGNETRGETVRDNERLEFFGDAILDFVLSRMLLERFPACREGELSRLRSTLVDEEHLASRARAIGLGEQLRLGRGEERSGGHSKQSLLADAYEALLAAVYLDGGLEPVERLIADHFGPSLAAASPSSPGKDFKSELQEFTQATLGAIPGYRLETVSGPDHARSFSVRVFLGDDCRGEGSGRSKKEAEQAAARAALASLRDEGKNPP